MLSRFRRKRERVKAGPTSDSPDSPLDPRGSIAQSSSHTPSIPKELSTSTFNVTENIKPTKGVQGLSVLYSPPEPTVDLIFVHGLGGDSRKTWTKRDPHSGESPFWPQDWLPRDPDFKKVRIQTFGYDSSIKPKGRKDCLNIRHIAKSFLGAISTSPEIAGSTTALILVGHSMGGLIIKKAYALARQQSIHEGLARRFAAIHFLGTPHRGADLAKTLHTILKVAYDRAYIADLGPSSGAIQDINEEFRNYATDLELWSFYETQYMKHFNSLIVDTDSAVLGYPNERQIPLTADHRSMCKSDSPSDANYTAIHDALVASIKNCASKVAISRSKDTHSLLKKIRGFLDVPMLLDDDLMRAREQRLHGSCQWILKSQPFIQWENNSTPCGRVLWIKAQPGAGKSILASFIIDHLHETGRVCNYFFFKHGDESKSHVSNCLRSIAFQAISKDSKALDYMSELQSDDTKLDLADARPLWRLLFKLGILSREVFRQYWVIDAIDECMDPAFLFETVIPDICKSQPIDILLLSRDSPELAQPSLILATASIEVLSIAKADTQRDIDRLIEFSSEIRQQMEGFDWEQVVASISHNSNGSFLWATLVLKELSHCHSEKEMRSILADVPKGMEPLYQRIVDSIADNHRNYQLTKAVLSWVACAVHPMSIDELKGALALDLDDSFPMLRESVTTLCGQLVQVDVHGKIQMIHETAREFLLRDTSGRRNFIEETAAHTQMAQICLRYLNGEEMRPPRKVKIKKNPGSHLYRNRVPFADYACTAFAYHLLRSDQCSSETHQLVEKFFNSNVLSWIEYMASTKHLGDLYQASRRFGRYLNLYLGALPSMYPEPDFPVIYQQAGALSQWEKDLERLTTTFSSVLKNFPICIYSSIPAFCPKTSSLHKVAGIRSDPCIIESSDRQWGQELLSFSIFPHQATVVCYGESFLAVGTEEGTVFIYDAEIYLQRYRIEISSDEVGHRGNEITHLSLNPESDLIIICSKDSCEGSNIQVWDVQAGVSSNVQKCPDRAVNVGFIEDCVVAVTEENTLIWWDIKGSSLGDPNVHHLDVDLDNEDYFGRMPLMASISGTLKMLAVAHDGAKVTIFDLEHSEPVFASQARSESDMGAQSVLSITFNNNPKAPLLAVQWSLGELTILDPVTGDFINRVKGNYSELRTRTVRHEDDTLMAITFDGIIHMLDFRQLNWIGRIDMRRPFTKDLSCNSSSVAMIYGYEFNIWMVPSVRSDQAVNSNRSPNDHQALEAVGATRTRVTAISGHPLSNLIFCGNSDGSICVYDRETATFIAGLNGHRAPIRHMAWSPRHEALLSIDTLGTVLLHRIADDKSALLDNHQSPHDCLIEISARVDGVDMCEKSGKYIIVTREHDSVLSMATGQCEKSWTFTMKGAWCWPLDDNFQLRHWMDHNQSNELIVCIDLGVVTIYRISDWTELKNFDSASESRTLYPFVNFLDSGGLHTSLVLEIDLGAGKRIGKRGIYIHERHGWIPIGMSATQHATDLALGPEVNSRNNIYIYWTRALGVSQRGRFIFVDKDSWVCSIDLQQKGFSTDSGDNTLPIEINCHFFVPPDWNLGHKETICCLIGDDIAVSRHGELLIIRSGFETIHSKPAIRDFIDSMNVRDIKI